MSVPVDGPLTDAIAAAAGRRGIPVALGGYAGDLRAESAVPLDWGTADRAHARQDWAMIRQRFSHELGQASGAAGRGRCERVVSDERHDRPWRFPALTAGSAAGDANPAAPGTGCPLGVVAAIRRAGPGYPLGVPTAGRSRGAAAAGHLARPCQSRMMEQKPMDNRERTVEALVEIPRGSRNKYEYDDTLGVIALDRTP
jgi:hypothetical protein